MRWICALVLTAVLTGSALADGQQDNIPENVRPVPPPGIAVPAADRTELEAGIADLGKEIDALRMELKNKPALLELLPDVQIFHNAARYALTYNEFFNAREIPVAKNLLMLGMERARQLHGGQAPWTTQAGLVVRGYVSRIDGSVQPYGLVVPPAYTPDAGVKRRLDCWFHGRGETLSEVNFLNDRMRNPGEFTPPGAIVLHLYGRYCNANKFAGEIDLLEALESVKKRYPIDENRIAVRGFSMGGAACWQFAVHYAGDWAAAAPGAGFSETADFLKVFQKEKVQPTWFEQKLWHWYDCTDYALNLFNCPTVAYSGEVDSQKQAADMMEKALAKEGITMTHIIGAKAGHFYTPDGRREVSRRIDAILQQGRNPIPSRVRLTTWTLRYNKMLWVKLDGMEKHWERATVEAEIASPSAITIKTRNVTGLTLEMGSGLCPLDNRHPPTITIDGQKLTAQPVQSDRSWMTSIEKSANRWSIVHRPSSNVDASLHKTPGLQGPIDDAFMDSFLMVSPTGSPMNEMVGGWVKSEEAHAIDHWRKQFRGEARVKTDIDVTDEDIAAHNLVLWGDPSSNKVLARIADKLPIHWDAKGVRVGSKTYLPDHHAPVLIFPNPLNPKRYVVLNSGFTFREYDYLNNARQIAKLPDWAVVDLSVKPNSRWPGKIVDAGFFGERWELLPSPRVAVSQK